MPLSLSASFSHPASSNCRSSGDAIRMIRPTTSVFRQVPRFTEVSSSGVLLRNPQWFAFRMDRTPCFATMFRRSTLAFWIGTATPKNEGSTPIPFPHRCWNIPEKNEANCPQNGGFPGWFGGSPFQKSPTGWQLVRWGQGYPPQGHQHQVGPSEGITNQHSSIPPYQRPKR